jgi:nucleoid DNA-binding protein
MAKKKKKAKKKASKASAKARTKSQIYGEIAEETELTRKQVAAVFESMADLIQSDLGKRGPGIFSIPGLLKIKVRTKPATKARKGVNPFTGEEMMFKAKPAKRVVKATALKALKEMV